MNHLLIIAQKARKHGFFFKLKEYVYRVRNSSEKLIVLRIKINQIQRKTRVN